MKNKKRNVNANRILMVIGILSIIAVALSAVALVKISYEKPVDYYLLGKAYETQGYYDEAVKSYEISLRIKPDPIVYNSLGNLKVFMGENTAGVILFEKGAEADASDTENNYDLARTYMRMNDYNSAEKLLISMVNRGKATSSVYDLLWTIYTEQEKWDKAESAKNMSLSLGK